MVAKHGAQDYIWSNTPLQPKYNQLQSNGNSKYLMLHDKSNTWLYWVIQLNEVMWKQSSKQTQDNQYWYERFKLIRE